MPDSGKRPLLSRLLLTLSWLCVLFGCGLFCVIPFASDAPRSAKDLAGWRLACWGLVIPVLCVAGLRFGYAFEKRGKHRKARLCFAIPVVAVLTFLTACGFWRGLWIRRDDVGLGGMIVAVLVGAIVMKIVG